MSDEKGGLPLVLTGTPDEPPVYKDGGATEPGRIFQSYCEFRVEPLKGEGMWSSGYPPEPSWLIRAWYWLRRAVNRGRK